ncbi:DNA-directed RNA polymerase sigma-70 factor [Puia dinghuensis]|uniref:DNA-directed RNA polymerase sigma-70 factor n=2 Tax=Puia dinghuensis TaxID=1792502 RepID=A0A8J2UD79_9BACT|nr:DNA-directed RNA polymerase sigma-70 factor [Puia dinghuensis]
MNTNARSDLFLEYKALLFSIAYNMLGNIDAAEDMVQDTFLKWMEADTDAVRNRKAFLVKMVTNASINYLSSARIKREKYVGIWLPEALPDHHASTTIARIESYHALSIGMLVLLEKLTPQERAIFLLKEIFAYDYDELAEIFGKTTDNCRQILKRAKENLGKDTRRFKVDMKVHEKILHNFLQAVAEGSMEDLIHLLKEDIMLFADGGGTYFTLQDQRITAFPKPIEGRDAIVRILLTLIPKFRQSIPDFNQETTIVNGMPALITYSGDKPVTLVALETDGDEIRNIYVQTNPDKLKHFTKP